MSGPAPALPVAPPWALGTGGGPAAFPPTSLDRGGAPATTGLNLQIPLPEDEPIPDAREFNPLGSVASAIVQSNVTIPGTTLVVPDATLGVIRGVSLYITNMLTTTNILWSLVINGASPQGFNQITIFPRAAPFVSNGFDALIRFQGAATISVVFSNLDGGTYTIGASYSGWFWPEASDQRWKKFGI